ncbi:hypothetical protein SEVIR_2G229201v4 [Setaria viridis]|uniref:Uncharacterized protein n=1 Tax=Setaria viridis TaxID=4556 RepID=A0A4U6VTV9_SETVI|nr:hypothetical protein SEVIR_2G229201v2 [Setaria viridis]TKW33361.1 hypothetical protein SEVIR_2G229201v2 [Setaria viridis]
MGKQQAAAVIFRKIEHLSSFSLSHSCRRAAPSTRPWVGRLDTCAGSCLRVQHAGQRTDLSQEMGARREAAVAPVAASIRRFPSQGTNAASIWRFHSEPRRERRQLGARQDESSTMSSYI